MDIQGELLKTIEQYISKYDNPSNCIYIGIVKEKIGAFTYLVEYDGAPRRFKTKSSFSIGDSVHVIYPQNNANNKFILEDVVSVSLSQNGVVTSVNGYTGDVDLDSDYYIKTEINTMIGNMKSDVLTNAEIDQLLT